MRAILPGRPQSKRQAVCTARWDGLRLVAYISGNTAVILKGPKEILQTIAIAHVESLYAITIDETSGRIAVCNNERLLVFDPIGRDEGDLRWTQTQDVVILDKGTARSLSWGSSEELLVGGTKLWLYHLPFSDPPRLIWEEAIANEVSIAHFSDDAELIASCGHYDRIVKIWRRLSFELDSTRFDVSYLPHPAAITNLHWRKPWHHEQNLDSLLYTFCTDNKIRVWSYSDPHSLSVVQLIATIDASLSIEPRRRSIGSMSRRRYACVLDSRDFSEATEKAMSRSQNNQVDHALEHLVEIANRSPEICVVFDGLGHMSVLGLENAGCKSRKPTEVFNVTLVDQVDIQLRFKSCEDEDYVQLCAFSGGTTPDSLSLLVQSYTGQIDWYESPITRFFDTASRGGRVRLLSSWSGHDLTVEHIARGPKGDRILSWSDEGQAILWSQIHLGALRRCSEIQTSSEITGVLYLEDIHYVLLLHENTVSLWNIGHANAVLSARVDLRPDLIPASMSYIGRHGGSEAELHFIIFYEGGGKEIWQVRIPQEENSTTAVANGFHPTISRVKKLSVVNDEVLRIVPQDMVQTADKGSMSYAESDRAYVSACGQIHIFSTSSDSVSGKFVHKLKRRIDTNTNRPALARTSSSGKCALVNRQKRTVSIWDLQQELCEWTYNSDGNEEIRKLVWNSTTRGSHFLFIGFTYYALIVGQLRYSTRPGSNTWCVFKGIKLRDFTKTHIGDVCWLSSGDLAISAGNQIFVLENNAEDYSALNLADGQSVNQNLSAASLVDLANSAVPLFHPEYLEALVIQDGLEPVEAIFEIFYEKLKYFADGDELPSDLGILPNEKQPGPRSNMSNGGGYLNGDTYHDSFDLEAIEDSFYEYLEMSKIWQLSREDQEGIATVFANVIKTGRHRNALDENALRYLYLLYSTPEDQNLHWRAFVFASRSTSQEALIDIITRQNDGKLTWSLARRTGLFIWLTDKLALQTQFENVARVEYTKGEDRNPVDCSLYYLALNKKTVLQSLWRRTFGVREKENTTKLLANDFEEPRWKATALKNAYALLSKRRFEYGAAFFLLGGSLKDAVNVCANQLNDIQLAIAVARVWDKDLEQSEQVLRDLLTRQLLTQSIDSEQGRWMVAWAYTTLDQPAQALQSIVRPLTHLIAADLEDHDGPLKSTMVRGNDPHLNVLYKQIRQDLIQKSQWTTEVLTQSEEWDFIQRTAQWWSRAGMDYLSLTLLRDWKFVPHQTPRQSTAPTNLTGSVGNVRDAEIDKTDLDIADAETLKADAVIEAPVQQQQPTKKKKQPPPTQFIEPSADSLLDSFGF